MAKKRSSKAANRRRVKKSAPRQAKKKTRSKKVAKRKALKPKKAPAPPLVGVVTHYFPHVNAAVIKLKKPLAIGDSIRITGHTTNFTQKVESMQINHAPVEKAGKGAEIGVQVVERVREHDQVTLADGPK